jgi:two-component system, NarL family, response regulator DevR
LADTAGRRIRASSGMQVVIVDDSAIVRHRLAEMLRHVARVTVAGEAASVAEALATIPLLRPDVVVLDLHLPDGDGVAVLESVKRIVPAPVVVMLSNYADDFYRTWCEAAGADFFLDKAKQFDELPGLLSRVMNATVEDNGAR